MAGSGKTHTLLNTAPSQPAEAGLVPRLVASLYVHIKSDPRNVYSVCASFVQIYNEQVDDLLKRGNTNLRIKPAGSGCGHSLRAAP